MFIILGKLYFLIAMCQLSEQNCDSKHAILRDLQIIYMLLTV
jgi:hypothetical protein